MPPRIVWTDGKDQIIRDGRATGATWDRLAAILGVSRWAVIMRGEAIGVPKPYRAPSVRTEAEREPYPPGHPETWGAITRGTVLDGARYAYQSPIPTQADEREALKMAVWAILQEAA